MVVGWLGTPHATCRLKRHFGVFLSFLFLCSYLVNASPHLGGVRQIIAVLSALTACGEGCSWVEALQCLVGRVERCRSQLLLLRAWLPEGL